MLVTEQGYEVLTRLEPAPRRRRSRPRPEARIAVAATLATAAAARPRAATAARWKRELALGREALRAGVRRAITRRTGCWSRNRALVDRVLRGLWTDIGAPAGCALIAVGGYGRGQLFPHSDVDVLILLPRPLANRRRPPSIERFIGLLWDIGLEVAHAVRTIAECETEMAGDITIRTSLLEHRHVAGSRALYQRFRQRIAAAIDVRAFYEAKALEQQQRHLQLPRHRLQPRAQRQGKPGRPARSADDRVDRPRGGPRPLLARACRARA